MFVARRGKPAWSGHRTSANRRAVLIGAGALAAAAAACAVIEPPFDLWPSIDELRADYRTGIGEQRRLKVADTAIEMNTRTSLAIPSKAGGPTQVRLIAGEASFAMSPQSAAALVVLAGAGRIVAKYAHFDIRKFDAAVCVTCLEGEVQVERDGRAAGLSAGRQLTYDDDAVGPVLTVDAREVTSWHDGFIVFRSTPLSAAIDEINRYRPGRVILLNASLAQKGISGRFKIARIDEILAWIAQATGAKTRSLPGGIVLLS
jgi:transmembrane sensor